MTNQQKALAKTLGLIVNPLAGIGGTVGLKGSDGLATVQKAFALGATRVSPHRAVEALRELSDLRCELELITYPAEMGEDEARESGFEPTVVGSIVSGHTTASDTQRAAIEIVKHTVDLLLFVGGDGTARDIYEAIGNAAPVLGIPAGVKVHSSVYAVNPRRAAELVKEFLKHRAPVQDMEVMDIDEDEFREGRVSARLFGYLKVPFERHLLQRAKVSSAVSGGSSRAIAEYVVDQMSDDYCYILGPGTTVRAVGDELGIDKTLLGVDLVHKRQLIGKDLNEKKLLELIADRKARIVVTLIGGQGYIFGRGNQQISPRVIREVGKENLIIISTQAKLVSLDGPLLVDTGDHELDRLLAGHIRVITGYDQESVWKVEY